MLIDGVILTLGIPGTAITPSTGIYGSIDSKTSRSLFGSGNVAIYGLGPFEYINLVYNNDHFEDIKLINNHALNLKEPYKSLPNALNNLSDVVDTKQDNLYFTTPLLKDTSNNITIDLSSYVLKSVFDSSFNDLQTIKQDNLLFTSPLLKDTSNNITIDLSGYILKSVFDASLNDLQTTKQENLLFTSPLLKDISNNITIDLSSYVLYSVFDSSFNILENTKQNIFTCESPLIKNDISNNITIDLSAYPLKINVDTSLNDLQTKKQDNLTFSTPLSKDISNNITIDLSDYAIGNIKGTKLTLNQGYSDASGNSLICYHNNAGAYFTDNSFNSFFNISSATNTNFGLQITPFITNYNRMFKNSLNNAIKIASTGGANSGVNSSTYILLDSGSNPTPSTNIGAIKFNIATNAQGALDRFIITPTTSIFIIM